MIIWINGAFGAGKTQTAYELHRRLPGSYVYDPENAGYFIRKNVPKTIYKDDFQDYGMWRQFNYEMLLHLGREYEGIILAPMTLVDPAYFGEIVEKLRENGITVHHFVLGASPETLRKRLKGRGDGANSWPAQQIERCVAGLTGDRFGIYLDTEKLSIPANAELIASLSGIELQPDRRGKFRKALTRIATQLKHIRIGG